MSSSIRRCSRAEGTLHLAEATVRRLEPGEEHYNPKVLYRGRKQATSEATLSAAESGKLLAHGMAPA